MPYNNYHCLHQANGPPVCSVLNSSADLLYVVKIGLINLSCIEFSHFGLLHTFAGGKLMGEDPRSLTASSVFHYGTWSGL